MNAQHEARTLRRITIVAVLLWVLLLWASYPVVGPVAACMDTGASREHCETWNAKQEDNQ